MPVKEGWRGRAMPALDVPIAFICPQDIPILEISLIENWDSVIALPHWRSRLRVWDTEALPPCECMDVYFRVFMGSSDAFRVLGTSSPNLMDKADTTTFYHLIAFLQLCFSCPRLGGVPWCVFLPAPLNQGILPICGGLLMSNYLMHRRLLERSLFLLCCPVLIPRLQQP